MFLWSLFILTYLFNTCNTHIYSYTFRSFITVHPCDSAWVYHDHRERWERYEMRLAHFASIVVKEDPDILVIQEVRVDNLFRDFINSNSMGSGGGGQLDHVLEHLHRASQLQSKDRCAFPFYQSIFQPAMLMFNRKKMNVRQEEGVAILSKYPIKNVESLLLSRNLSDSQDDHQRIVLKAAILHNLKLDGTQVYSNDENRHATIDVLTSHFR